MSCWFLWLGLFYLEFIAEFHVAFFTYTEDVPGVVVADSGDSVDDVELSPSEDSVDGYIYFGFFHGRASSLEILLSSDLRCEVSASSMRERSFLKSDEWMLMQKSDILSGPPVEKVIVTLRLKRRNVGSIPRFSWTGLVRPLRRTLLLDDGGLIFDMVLLAFYELLSFVEADLFGKLAGWIGVGICDE